MKVAVVASMRAGWHGWQVRWSAAPRVVAIWVPTLEAAVALKLRLLALPAADAYHAAVTAQQTQPSPAGLTTYGPILADGATLTCTACGNVAPALAPRRATRETARILGAGQATFTHRLRRPS